MSPHYISGGFVICKKCGKKYKLKWFLKNNGRQDLILEMTEREAAFLKKELAPDYSLVGDWGNRAMASINRHLDTFVNIKQVYMYLGIRIYITVKAEVRNES
jgi:hypothetical protein